MTSVPHLVQMDKRYNKKGLTIIADEVQGSATPAIEKLTDEWKVKFPVTTGTTRPPTMKGMPHAVVFDPSGKLIFAGHPSQEDFEKSIKKALKDVELEDDDKPAGPVIDKRAWTNSEGNTINASVTSIEGDNVTFKLQTGKSVKYPIAKLSEEDQKLIKEAASKDEEEDE